MVRIQKLPVNLINQIAAGEVIERPASVVKELVENSIDAGSTKIQISVENDCRNIRIADDGCGIHPDDVYVAFEKHATSKISDEKDLWNIHTLGFRGEALASICSIAKVICTTRTKDFDYGVKITAENSVIKQVQTGCACGTIMEIENIFSSQPARLKFLKNDKTEFSYIQEIVTQLAFANPKIAFELRHNGSEVLKTKVNSNLYERIGDIYSDDVLQNLKEVSKTDRNENITITGYVSIPSYTRSSKKAIRVYVNSRSVRCPIILKAVDTAFKNLLPIGKYPFVILNIDISPNDIDVNVHPSKKEIRWKNPNLIFNFVISAIDKALTSENYIKSDNNQVNNNIISVFQNNNETDDSYYISAPAPAKSQFYYKDYSGTENKITSFSEERQSTLIPTVFQTTVNEENEYTIIGQLKNTYILIETPDGLEIVDQHIADERYLYEKLKSQKEIVSQFLLISDTVEIEPSETEILKSAETHLQKYGYEIKFISPTQVQLTRVPQILSMVNPKEIITELLQNINGSLDGAEEKILITTACKAAIKAGEKISLWQAEELIKRWKATKNPEVCPHGRPINHIIPIKNIAKFFDRQNKN